MIPGSINSSVKYPHPLSPGALTSSRQMKRTHRLLKSPYHPFHRRPLCFCAKRHLRLIKRQKTLTLILEPGSTNAGTKYSQLKTIVVARSSKIRTAYLLRIKTLIFKQYGIKVPKLSQRRCHRVFVTRSSKSKD